jgi:hypothetical protein
MIPMRDILHSLAAGLLIVFVVGLILGLGTFLLPLIGLYILGKHYRENF